MNLVNGVMGGSLPAADRGLAYGDGVFRTLRVHAGEPQWWADHYAKLAGDAGALGLVCPQEDVLHDDVGRLADGRDGVAKLILTRGCGERGYQPPAHPASTRIASFQAGSVEAGGVADIVVRWCSLRLGRQPRLAGIKHLNRLENVLARAEWSDPTIDEGLLCDDTGAVVSGVSGNLFIVHGDVLLTPDLGQCGVAGVARERILRVARARGAAVQVTRISPQMLLDADAVVLCNSIRGVRRVARLENRSWAPGAWPRRLSTWLHEVD